MRRYFFDRIGNGRKEYDYRGKRLASNARARQIAELIAMDLELSPEGEWSGWTVGVYTPKGECCVLIPVKDPDPAFV